MVSQTIETQNRDIVLGGYSFPHSGGYSANGLYTVTADTQEHLEQILADIDADSLPLPETPIVLEDVLAETVSALQIAEERINGLDSALAAIVAESQL